MQALGARNNFILEVRTIPYGPVMNDDGAKLMGGMQRPYSALVPVSLALSVLEQVQFEAKLLLLDLLIKESSSLEIRRVLGGHGYSLRLLPSSLWKRMGVVKKAMLRYSVQLDLSSDHV